MSVALRQSVEPFVGPALLSAMARRARLRIEGPVSPLLLSRLDAIQRAYVVLRPQWRPVEVSAEGGDGSAEPVAGRGAFLSMGLDSTSLVLRDRQRLTHYVMLRTLGSRHPPLDDRVQRGAAELAEREGTQLILLDSNMRDVSRGIANWTRFHAVVLAGAAQAVAGSVGCMTIPSTMWEMEMVSFATGPWLDPLWSTEEVAVLHDRTDLTRTEKARALVGDELALRYLHPCPAWPSGAYNCGQCGKCLRTLASLRAVGINDLAAFERPLDLSLLAAQPATMPGLDRKYRELLWSVLTFAPWDTELADAIRAAMIPPASRIQRIRRQLGRVRAT